ncbi:hypothetical protein WMY93_005078 [Mugilogobius chulae]|uniref:PDZ and LIM domain protein 2 n=1 Tax=Mugilogobius chulae TaxID=88201 RepID=A0AAW0PRH3_9GOBI
MLHSVTLQGSSPWGFRISGGRDFKNAITISKVTAGGKAEQADLKPGDIILQINSENTSNMLNVEAQNKIKTSKQYLQLEVERPKVPDPPQTNGTHSPEQLTGRFQESLIVSRDENQNYREYSLSSPGSLSPGPYSPNLRTSPNGKLLSPNNTGIQNRTWSTVDRSQISPDYTGRNSRTPTPPGRYSPQSPIEREPPLSPRRSLSLSADIAMQKYDKESEVYKMIQENRGSNNVPRQSNTFKMLQEVLEADEKEAIRMFPGNLSPNPPKTSSVAGVAKQHMCEKCGCSIPNHAVRITDDRYRHPECYTCADCGLKLQMRGHFWAGDEMYCEKHAKERYVGPGRSPHS